MIWLIYALIVDETNYIFDDMIKLNDNVLSWVSWFLDDDMNIVWRGECGGIDNIDDNW